MGPEALAAALAGAPAGDRDELLARHEALPGLAVAHALKAFYLDHNSSDPTLASGAADSLLRLAARTHEPETLALAAWADGMVALQIDGNLEQAVERIGDAARRFEELGQPAMVANTQVAAVYALAMLGRYDDAIKIGLNARAIFISEVDLAGAGKIEQNLGNLYHRRERLEEAEQFYRSASQRFAVIQDPRLQSVAENGLANVLALRHQFRDAAQRYEVALAHAQQAGVEVTQAEIECNIGCLALFQGRYDRALQYLEASRRRYLSLEMEQRAALSELELAEAYLELNLFPEAAAIFERVGPLFQRQGMRAERARALAHLAQSLLALEQKTRAVALLKEARELYLAEANDAGAAGVTLIQARIAYQHAAFEESVALAESAERTFASTGMKGRLLLARWLRGESLRALDRGSESELLLRSTLSEAEQQMVPQVVQRCHTSLGLLAASAGEPQLAEQCFRAAMEQVEAMRAPLPADEFRTAFVADKLAPFVELARLYLDARPNPRIEEALHVIEQARSRSLADTLAGVRSSWQESGDAFDQQLVQQLDELRAELNWLYNRISRSDAGDGARRGESMELLHRALREREQAVLDLTRQLQQRQSVPRISLAVPEAEELMRELGPDSALIEFFALDGEILAFVVTSNGVDIARHMAREQEVEELLEHLRFQMETVRYGTNSLQNHMSQLLRRCNHYLGRLYELLLRPLEQLVGERRLVIVPYRALHYVPFHALFDGTSYVIDRREVSYAPSATVLRHCLSQPTRAVERALLVGVPDTMAPRVRDEIAALTPLFTDPVVLLEEAATSASLRAGSPTADVLHLACHGQFRPDNPLFSSLKLSDEWLTVRDAYELDLRQSSLVTLSACETGISSIAPGDELIGLARGFFFAGAPSLMVSLWVVDDASTSQLMTHFYRELRGGSRPVTALRHAQLALKHSHPHPFFWSPFILLGRW